MQAYLEPALADAIRHAAAKNDIPESRFISQLLRTGLGLTSLASADSVELGDG